LLVAKQTH